MLGTVLSAWRSYFRNHVWDLMDWCGCLSKSHDSLPYSQHLILFRVLHSALQSWAFAGPTTVTLSPLLGIGIGIAM